jgi:hypothetical protein
MIRSTLNGLTVRLFNTEDDARRNAAVVSHSVDEVREIDCGWLYRSDDKWFDTDGWVRGLRLS